MISKVLVFGAVDIMCHWDGGAYDIQGACFGCCGCHVSLGVDEIQERAAHVIQGACFKARVISCATARAVHNDIQGTCFGTRGHHVSLGGRHVITTAKSVSNVAFFCPVPGGPQPAAANNYCFSQFP